MNYATLISLSLLLAHNNAHPAQTMQQALPVMPTHLVVIGCHGSGKDTCVNYILCKRPNLVPILPGQLIRDEIKGNTPHGKVFLQPLYEGSNLSQQSVAETLLNRYACELVCSKIMNEAITRNKSFILNGLPRSIESFEFLHNFFKQHGLCEQVCFIFLDATPKTCADRIQTRLVCPCCSNTYNRNDLVELVCSCGTPLAQRSTDDARLAEKRIQFYQTHTEGLIDIIKKWYPVITIDAELPFDDKKLLYDSIIDTYYPFIQTSQKETII